MLNRIFGWLTAALVLSGLCGSALAQNASPQSVPPNAGRSRTSGATAERTAQARCLVLTTSAFETYSGPQIARENGAGAFFMSCMMHQMPNDWPNAPDVRDQAARMADIARRADPSSDVCLLTACTSPPADGPPLDAD